MTSHQHHNHCKHALEFCEKCDKPYCTKCNREWPSYTWFSQTNPWFSQTTGGYRKDWEVYLGTNQRADDIAKSKVTMTACNHQG